MSLHLVCPLMEWVISLFGHEHRQLDFLVPVLLERLSSEFLHKLRKVELDQGCFIRLGPISNMQVLQSQGA